MAKRTNLNGDIQIALASIAAELVVELDDHARDRILATLRMLSAAHYQAGVRDTMVRIGNTSAALKNEHVASPTDVTPVVGPYGRRLRSNSAKTTPLVPPPRDRGQKKSDD